MSTDPQEALVSNGRRRFLPYRPPRWVWRVVIDGGYREFTERRHARRDAREARRLIKSMPDVYIPVRVERVPILIALTPPEIHHDD